MRGTLAKLDQTVLYDRWVFQADQQLWEYLAQLLLSFKNMWRIVVYSRQQTLIY